MRVTRLLMVALTLAAVATTLVSAQPGVVGSDGGPNDVERESRVQKTRVLAKIASGILGIIAPPEFLENALVNMIGGESSEESEVNDISALIEEIGTTFLGKLAFFIFFPITVGVSALCVGPCFYSWRFCCKCCGGKNQTLGVCGCGKKRDEVYTKNEVWIPVVAMLVTGTVLVIFMLIALVLNVSVNNSIDDLFADAEGTRDDVVNRANFLVDEVDALVSDTANSFSDVNSVLDGSDINGTLGDYISAQFQPSIDNLSGNLTRMQVAIANVSALVDAQDLRIEAVRYDVELLRAELFVLDAELQNASTRTINGTVYSTNVPDVTGIADDLPDIDNGTLTGAQNELAALPNFTRMNEDMLADWANVSASINAQVDDANAELNTSISDMLSDVDSSLGEVRVQISTFEDESEAFAEEARAVKADYIDEYNPYRKLVVEAPVYVCFVVLVLGAIGLGLGVMGKRLSFLYTIMCIFCFILIFFFCLGHTVYFPITWVLANVCELKDVAIEAARESGTSDTAAVWAAFDECQQPEGNILNTDIFNITQALDEAGVSDVQENLKADLEAQLDFADAFDFGGNDIFGEITNATSIDYADGFNFTAFDFNVTDQIPYNLTSVLANTTAAKEALSPETFNWSWDRCDTPLSALNANLAPDGLFVTFANYTVLPRGEGNYTNGADTINSFNAVDGCIAINATVNATIVELYDDITDIEIHIVEIDNNMVKPLQDNMTSLQGDLDTIEPAVNDLDRVGNQTRDNAALIIDGVDLLMNETVGVVLDLVLQKVDDTYDRMLDSIDEVGECAFLGRNYRALVTDVCDSLLGSMQVVWVCCSTIAILLMFLICFGTCVAKRLAWVPKKGKRRKSKKMTEYDSYTPSYSDEDLSGGVRDGEMETYLDFDNALDDDDFVELAEAPAKQIQSLLEWAGCQGLVQM